MKRGMLLLAAVLSAAGSVPLNARAEAMYRVTVIGGADSAAYDVNNLGQVVGYMAAGDNYHAFLYDGAGVTDLGTLGNGGSYAARLNESGTVVGTSYADDRGYAFVYAAGVMTALPMGAGSSANAINNAGVIVGTMSATDSTGDYQPHAYTYAGGLVTDLGTLPGAYGTYGNAINGAGEVAGTLEVGGPPNRPTNPFFYSDGALQDTGNFGGIFSSAWAMNDHGDVVGSAGVPNIDGNLYPFHAFLYDAGGLHDLGAMAAGGNSSAYGINELGQIVGYTDTDAGPKTYLYSDGNMVLLDSLIDPASGWTITNANAINDFQQIAGRACKGDICYAVRLDLASAVPEPGQATMLAAGMLSVLGLGMRRRIRSPKVRRPRQAASSAWHRFAIRHSSVALRRIASILHLEQPNIKTRT